MLIFERYLKTPEDDVVVERVFDEEVVVPLRFSQLVGGLARVLA